MKKEIYKQIEIPEDVEAEIDGAILKVKGKEGEQSREFKVSNIEFKKEDNQIILGSKKATKKEKKIMNTIAAHIRNMIEGVQKKFEYNLKVCSSHFPMSVEIKEGEIILKNFFGEKDPRKTKISPGAEVEIDGEIITVKSVNKELAGQVAADIETMTEISKKDRRVFQDGIYIISKPGGKDND